MSDSKPPAAAGDLATINIEELKRKRDTQTVAATLAAADTSKPAQSPPPRRKPPRADRIGKRLVSTYLDEAQHKALKHLAVDHDTTVQDVIARAVAAYIAKHTRSS